MHRRYLALSLAATTECHYHLLPNLWHLRMSPDTVTCHLGDKVPGLRALTYGCHRQRHDRHQVEVGFFGSLVLSQGPLRCGIKEKSCGGLFQCRPQGRDWKMPECPPKTVLLGLLSSFCRIGVFINLPALTEEAVSIMSVKGWSGVGSSLEP